MYAILFETRVEKEYRDLPREILKRMDAKIQALRNDPRPSGVKKLLGKKGEGWRLKVGNYRLLYRIDDEKKTVTIYRIKHRKEVYQLM